MNTFSNKPLALFVASAVIGGCASTDEIANSETINQDQQALWQRVEGEYNLNTQDLAQAPYVYSDELDVLGGAFEVADEQPLPPAFDQVLNFGRGDDMDLGTIINTINARYQKYGIVVNVSDDARKYIDETFSSESDSAQSSVSSNDDSTGTQQLIDIVTLDSNALESASRTSGFNMELNVQGLSLRHALNLITANTNTWWKYENDRATIYRTEPVTFLVDANGKTYTKNFNQAASADGSETSSGSTFKAVDETKNALSEISSQLNLMLTSSGEVYVNEHDHSVTVKDTPPSIKKVKKFLKDYNYRATTSYGVTVDVFEIITEITQNQGIDWETAFETAGSGKVSIGSPSFVPDASLGNMTANVITGNWNLQAAIQMVHKNASLYSHIRKTGKTKNAVPTIISSIEDQGIVSGRSVTVTSDGFSQQSTETKLIDEGFSITATPRITSMGRIDLDVTVNTKVIQDVEKVGSETEEIQLEETRRQNNNANVIMRDGATTIVSAYERSLSSSDVQSLNERFPWWAGGNTGAKRYKANLIVVVKPVILER
ncbi:MULTISPECIES: type II and III secretion system protein [Vibrio]|uniref:type II and III secretion system protein n=1 Tax=Vibrio TaxID=662 RepID=UPI001E4FC140|nr:MULTISPECIES: type II and III secretion system protein [Vibrio]MCC2524951.1 type II and III secretion system protein [Vibrio coralliilyticus]USD35496.1 hypothetical protein J8Z27_23030 [Vibrio sp. SCSIO 43186]USD72620.1 hypothetical protein J4N41_23035 [Vibrio sp. SCSIO 43139]USD99011.1 hypothetical protein CTT30_23345 [Vibrio coralliilyticus]